MKLGLVEMPLSARHGNFCGSGLVQPLRMVASALTPVHGAELVTVYNTTLFEIPKGRIVPYDDVDGQFVLPSLCI